MGAFAQKIARCAIAHVRTMARWMRSEAIIPRRDAEDARAARCWRRVAKGNPLEKIGRFASTARAVFRHREAANRNSAAGRAGSLLTRPNGSARPAAPRFEFRDQSSWGSATPVAVSAPGHVTSATSAARPASMAVGHAGRPSVIGIDAHFGAEGLTYALLQRHELVRPE